MTFSMPRVVDFSVSMPDILGPKISVPTISAAAGWESMPLSASMPECPGDTSMPKYLESRSVLRNSWASISKPISSEGPKFPGRRSEAKNTDRQRRS